MYSELMKTLEFSNLDILFSPDPSINLTEFDIIYFGKSEHKSLKS